MINTIAGLNISTGNKVLFYSEDMGGDQTLLVEPVKDGTAGECDIFDKFTKKRSKKIELSYADVVRLLDEWEDGDGDSQWEDGSMMMTHFKDMMTK